MNEIKHLSVDERVALGRAARERALPSSHAGWSPAHDRPDPVALLEQQDATRAPRSRAGAPRADDGLPVHVLPRRSEDHGCGSEGHADRRTDGATVRRRAPVELRCVRLTGTGAGVRPQRLRRDPAGPVRVRRQAHGREFHDRGAQQRLHRHPGTRARRARPPPSIERRWPGSRRCARWTSGTRTSPRQTCSARSRQ